jgi:hypothetical protein
MVRLRDVRGTVFTPFETHIETLLQMGGIDAADGISHGTPLS